jgi:CMP-N-acetylneuraminic acid synthetase
MPSISILINARLQSSRLPRKLVLPFAGTTLIDIALKKLNCMDFFAHRYFAVAEDDLKERALKFTNVEILNRRPEAVLPGYGDHRIIYEHYASCDSDYIMWLNPCHPMLSLDTIRKAADYVLETKYNSYTSVVPTTDWIFDENGIAITNTQASMLSTAHSKRFYCVAHAFHVINKAFFLKDYQIWTLTKDDPHLIEIPEEENYDVNTPLEFEVAEAAYRRFQDQQF